MTETRKVRGLLDVVEAEAEGVAWEVANFEVAGLVPGMGKGASPEAIRWAYRGYRLEIEERLHELQLSARRGKGRPQRPEELHIGNMRAFHMWLEVRCMPLSFRTKETNRSLITWMCGREDLSKTARKLWPQENTALEKSLSAGRRYWEINARWESAKCEAFWSEHTPKKFPQNQR